MRKSKADIICDNFHKKHEEDPAYKKEAETYILNKLESDEINLWIKEHEKVCLERKKQEKAMKQGHFPATGWCNYTIEFTPTSIGNIIVVKCRCGKERNVTDYESM